MAWKYSKDFLLESIEAQPIYFLLYTVFQITDILVLATTIKDPMTHKKLDCNATDSYNLPSAAWVLRINKTDFSYF